MNYELWILQTAPTSTPEIINHKYTKSTAFEKQYYEIQSLNYKIKCD